MVPVAAPYWPAQLSGWNVQGLEIFEEPPPESDKPRTLLGDGIGVYGIPTENQADPSAMPTFRGGNIGRMTDPFANEPQGRRRRRDGCHSDRTRATGQHRLAHARRTGDDRDRIGVVADGQRQRTGLSLIARAQQRGVLTAHVLPADHHDGPWDHILVPPGTKENPLTTEQVAAKTRDLITPVLGKEKSEKLIAQVSDLEKVKDMRTLRPLWTMA